MNYDKPRAFAGGVPLPNAAIAQNLAGKTKQLPRLSGTNALNGSPSPRREERPYTPGENEASKENSATPGKNVLSSNITPRSGSRKARAETASPMPIATPDGTPTSSRPVSSLEKRDRTSTESRAGRGLGIRSHANGRTSRSESLVSDGPVSSSTSRPALLERNNSGRGLASPKSPPMFFHASDVQATVAPKQHAEKSSPQTRLPGYVSISENLSNGRTSAMSNNSLPDEQRSKFFYANDTVEQSKSPPPRLPNGTTSNRPTLQTIYSSQAPPPTTPQRAPSPLKEELIPRRSSISQASPRRHTRLVSNGGSEIIAPDAKTNLSRRSSLNSRTGNRGTSRARDSSVGSRTENRGANHARSSSVQSLGESPARRNSIVQLETSPITSSKRISIVGATGALPHSVNPPTSFGQDYTGPLSPGIPQSPTKPQSKVDQMNELAANARRERKVLDLEISNSSLLAINRTLEREMRKQTAELRHFRKLSRTGRLSVAPTSRSSRKSRLSETDTAIGSDEILSAPESDSDDPEDSSSDSTSPQSPTSRAVRARFQDSERPSLDLSAHRALLIESQKMNQSIKRCLSHTDALIADGRKALEYHAEAPEIENIGPKVLTPDEYEDDALIERGQGLLSPGLGPGASGTNPWERSLAQIGGLDGGGLETPDYSKWASGAEPALPLPHVDPANEAGDDSQLKVEPKMTRIRPALPYSSPTQSEEDSSSEEGQADADNKTISLSAPSRTPPPEEISFQASLDGLDDSPSPHPTAFRSSDHKPAAIDSSLPPTSSRPTSAPQNPPPNPSAVGNTPGNRSSIQNFGQYLGLQSLSIFGTKEGG